MIKEQIKEVKTNFSNAKCWFKSRTGDMEKRNKLQWHLKWVERCQASLLFCEDFDELQLDLILSLNTFMDAKQCQKYVNRIQTETLFLEIKRDLDKSCEEKLSWIKSDMQQVMSAALIEGVLDTIENLENDYDSNDHDDYIEIRTIFARLNIIKDSARDLRTHPFQTGLMFSLYDQINDLTAYMLNLKPSRLPMWTIDLVCEWESAADQLSLLMWSETNDQT